jgi:RNA polymerase sigma factor (sigma-70 family)
MANRQLDVVLRHIHALSGPAPELTDGQLLSRVLRERDGPAFAELVRRHGAMVLGVCRRVLRHGHDAEDAFQATFLVLFKKANTLTTAASVAGYLYTVAYHAALKARANAARRRLEERQAVKMAATQPPAADGWHTLRPVLDDELSHLPDKYRLPLVLCYLEGKTGEEAARLLGWPEGTVKGRLARGRALLRGRLARRGVTLSAAALAALLAETAFARIPSRLLQNTVQTALRCAAGEATALTSAPVALAEGVLQTMFTTKIHLGTTLVLILGLLTLGAGALTRQAIAQREPPGAAPPAATQALPKVVKPAEEGEKKDAAAEGKTELAVTGTITDEDGKPIPDARVALFVTWNETRRGAGYREEIAAQGKTDKDGKYRLTVKDAPPERAFRLQVLAGADKYGLAVKQPARDPARKDNIAMADLRLTPEHVVAARLIDLQGQPAAGVKVRVVRFAIEDKDARIRPGGFGGAGGVGDTMIALPVRPPTFQFPERGDVKGCPLWPAKLTTDAEGRFRLTGFSRDQTVTLLVEDDRFALRELTLETGAKEAPKEVALSLDPARRLEGKVVYEDTGKPAAGISLNVSTSRRLRRQPAIANTAFGKTDTEGRYSINLYVGDTFTVDAFAPAGEPYLGVRREGSWPAGAAKKELEVALPRGVFVQGKVEAGSKPVDQASLYFLPQQEDNPKRIAGLLYAPYYPVFSQPDGSFKLAVPPGPGHLIVAGPTRDFAYQTITEQELLSGKTGGAARYFHGGVALNVNLEDKPKDVKVALQRGTTIKGKVVGPDGKPVSRAVVFAPGEVMDPNPDAVQVLRVGFPRGENMRPILVRDGVFELHNCHPEKTYRVCIVDLPPAEKGEQALPEVGFPVPVIPAGRTEARLLGGVPLNALFQGGADRLGVTAEMSAKDAGDKPVTIKLSACGSAKVRFVDGDGKPQRPDLWLELLVQPGPSVKDALEKNVRAGEAVLLAGPTGVIGRVSPLTPDDKGELTLPALIPGATYRLKIYKGNAFQGEIAHEQDIKVEAGKTLKLPDVVVPAKK